LELLKTETQFFGKLGIINMVNEKSINISLLDNGDINIKCNWDDKDINTNDFGYLVGAIRAGTIGEFVIDAINNKSDSDKTTKSEIIQASEDFINQVVLKVQDTYLGLIKDKKFKKQIKWDYYNTSSLYEDNDDDDEDDDDDEKFVEKNENVMLLELIRNNNHNGQVNKYLKRECWICYTNFPIQEYHVKLISQINGIEFTHFFSKHCLLVILGKLFDWEDIQPKINSVLKD